MSQSSNRSNRQHTQGAAIAIGGDGDPGPAGLKAERIQEALVIDPRGVTRLKAERIQLALRDLSGWTLQRGGITRTFELADKSEAARLLQFVAGLEIEGEMPEVHIRRGLVTFVLPTVDDGSLEKPLFEMAQSLAAGN
jgi:pterin-4a-carbinolamine dehydratase